MNEPPSREAVLARFSSLTGDEARPVFQAAIGWLCDPTTPSEPACELSEALARAFENTSPPPEFVDSLVASLAREGLRYPRASSRTMRSERFLLILLTVDGLAEDQLLRLVRLPVFDAHGTVKLLQAKAPTHSAPWLAAFHRQDWVTRSALVKGALDCSELLEHQEIRLMIRRMGDRTSLHRSLPHARKDEWMDAFLQLAKLDPAGVRNALGEGLMVMRGVLEPQDLLPLLNHPRHDLRSLGFQLLGQQ